MRFLLDENLPKSLAVALRSEGHDATRVQDLGMHGASDDAVWAHAREMGATFITADRDFPRPGPKPPAMMLIRGFERVSVTLTVTVVLDAIGALGDDIGGLLVVVTPGRVRRRRL